MENSQGEKLHCEDRLRTTLHCDDKEKLRRKLAHLQREYLKTVQRLQRAERSEAVRRHSRVTQHEPQEQRSPAATPNPGLKPTPATDSGTASGAPQCQGHPGIHPDQPQSTAVFDTSRTSHATRLLLPSEAACPQTPDGRHDAARGHRPSPALRLRSRRSRQRWERRSAEVGRSSDNSEEGRELSERMETDRTEGGEGRVKTEGKEVLTESEELFSCTESESPSLLLTHWNTKEAQGEQGQSAIHTEGWGQGGTQNGIIEEIEGGEKSGEQRVERLCEDSGNKDTGQNAAEKVESEKSHDNTIETKEKKGEMVGGEHAVKSVGVLESCTLVEGLLFPAEYYVRTTRRMTLSQSQPDMQAVILSQLSVGRQRRGRGRRTQPRTHSHKHERSHRHADADFSSMATVSTSVDPWMKSQAAHTSPELNNQASSEISEQISACQSETDAGFSSTATAARPARGRRRRRGRGRGKPQASRCSRGLDSRELSLGQTSDGPQPASPPASSSPSFHGAGGPQPCLGPEVVPVSHSPQPESPHSTATQPLSGDSGAQSNSACGHLEKVYSIFLRSSSRNTRSTQMRSVVSWQSLLLPSSPPVQTSLLPLPLPSPSLGPLTNFDIPQDFHLPDDQFASFKLHKLRQVAVESGVELFTSPSYNTRRSSRQNSLPHCSSSPVMPLPLPLSLTPSIENSPHPAEAKHTATRPAHPHSLSMEHRDQLTSRWSAEEPSDGGITETAGQQQMENPQRQTHPASTQAVMVVQHCAADLCGQKDAVALGTHNHGSIAANTDAEQSVKLHVTSAYEAAGKVSDCVTEHSDELQIKESSVILSVEQKDCSGVVRPAEDQRSTDHQTKDRASIDTLFFDCPLQKSSEEPLNNFTALHVCSDAPAEPPVQHVDLISARDSKEAPEATVSPPRENQSQEKCPPPHRLQSQFLLSPPLASAPFITPHLRSSAPPPSPALPSVGLTPHPVPAAIPLTPSPSAPVLTLPPPHSPSTQALSPPALSPCLSLESLPLSQPPASPAAPLQALPEPFQRADPASSVRGQDSGGPTGLRTGEAAEQHMMRRTHTLKAPAGGCLVDACCLMGSSGGLCVAAAGKWAVCLWSQSSAADWSLTHTWAFNEPVISVFPVPDAAGLMCVTLGQLEIREVRVLSCCSPLQVLLCDGVIQAAVGVSKSRVVTSAHSAPGSSLQVFKLSDSGSAAGSQPLVSPGVCVGALAPVEGLLDALVGTDEGGSLFIWNLKTGQLLRRITLGDGFSHTACLRGYSYCGVLFVLLQHQLLSSLEEEEKETAAKDRVLLEEEDEEEEENEDKKKTALFSLVAVNPLSGKSTLATRLYPPKAWSGRLCEADASSGGVVGLSQSGCVCVWEPGRRGGAARMLWAPESEGWQLAQWGGAGTLVTGHHSGDVTLHYNSTSQKSRLFI